MACGDCGMREEKIIDFIHSIEKLKRIKRTYCIIEGVKNPESVADHSFRTSLMALLFAKKFNLDENKCVKMAIVHELAEIKVGDIIALDKKSYNKKIKLEKKAIKKILKGFEKDEIYFLWKEYTCRKTLESRFVYELNVLEFLFQVYEYEKSDNINLKEIWKNKMPKIKNAHLNKIAKILFEKRKII